MALPICQIDASHNRTKTRRFSMRLKNSQTRYGAPAIALHWLMLLLLIAVYACMELRGIYPKGSALRDGIKTWHYMLGLSVFGLVWLRLAFALIGTTPDIKPAAPKWQMRLALAMKVALYAFMIGMPLLGWLLLSAEGKPMPSFFGVQLAALIAENKELGKQIKELHETFATVGYFLIGLHAIVGLYHHYIVRDNTLRRILPSRH
jgi:cytochrome b561